jgi:hypothetical protein
MYIKDQHECNTKIYIPALKQISPTNRIGGVMVSMSASASSVVNLSFESSQRLVAPLVHNILIPSQPVFALSP